MITAPTVIIIGAGASFEYGFPLGAKLVKQAVFHTRAPVTALCKALVSSGVSADVAGEFSVRLRDSDSNSIDTFLENNREEYVRIGKAAIALVILLAEADCLTEGRLLAKPPADHWLKYIWNVVREACSVQTLQDNRIGFVTFNYDRVLETYLDGVIQNAFNLEPAAATALREQAFPIVHLHGQVSNVGFGAYPPGALLNEQLQEIASGIRVVHDSVPRDDRAFERAFDMIRSAKLICCLGFGYHPTNVGRLRLKELKAQKAQFCGSAYGMGAAQIQQAENMLGLSINPTSGNLKCEAFLQEHVVLV
ncbi:SIR2 family protein [Candidatus Bipolaricaulota bacterium]|nr:SIR2 family protein [Candidatus Bipolaricaulota bacterium]